MTNSLSLLLSCCIGDSTVRKYIRELRSEKPEIFVPLAFEPGESMEVDWGDAYCYLNNIKTKVSCGVPSLIDSVNTKIVS